MLSAILVLFAVLSIVYNVVTPLFEGPDEAAHFLYIDYLAAGEGLPALGDAPREVLWEGLQQPPLYYAIAALLTGWIDRGDLHDLLWHNPHRGGETGGINLYYHSTPEAFPYRGTTLAVHLARLLNTLCGVVTVLATFLAAREIFPRSAVFALGAAAVVAFNPQFLFTAGSVSNDGLLAMLCALGTWLLLRMLRRNDLSRRDALWLGLVAGLAAAAKSSGLAFAVPAALTVAVTARRRQSWAILWRGCAAVASGIILLGGWWYLRNLGLYGDPLARNGLIAIGADIIRPETLPLGEALVYSTWLQKSFWGVFGNGVLMDFAVYHALEIAMRVSLLGLAVWLVRQTVRRSADSVQWLSLGLLALWSGVIYLSLVRFMQTVDATNQGRLLFPAISALAILFLWGLSGFFPERLRAVPPAIAGTGLLVLALVAPFRYILPAYAQPPAGLRLPSEQTAAGMPVRFAERIELLDYAITPLEVTPGNPIHVTLDWRCLAPLETSYKLFIHVLGYDGERLTQLDTIPYRGRFATVLWQPGQEFRDEYDLFITGKARPSLGRIQIGFFPWDDPGNRLSAFTQDGQLIGDHVDLAPFKIAPRTNERPAMSNATHVEFGDVATLIGYDLQPVPAHAGEPLTWTLYWEAKMPPGVDYTVFVHVLDRAANIVAQQDMPPQGGNYPTSIWATGEFIADPRTLTLPEDLPAGTYALAVGWYEPGSGQRLPATAAGQPVPDGRAVVCALDVS